MGDDTGARNDAEPVGANLRQVVRFPYAGWSLIGFTSSQPRMAVNDYLASLGGAWNSLYRFDPATGWEPAKPGAGFTKMTQGRGHWIYMTSAGTLTPP